MADKNKQEWSRILNFWFDELTHEDWYRKDEALDALMRARFQDSVEQALAGKLTDWHDRPDGCLASIILLDQMTRNIFRDTPRAFAGDDMALALSRQAVEQGQLDKEKDVFRRIFMLMPFMHSEDLAVQGEGLGLFRKYTDEKTADFAQRHLVVIEKFGRFPHRKEILGRNSSAAELQYLAQPNAGF